MDPLIGRSLGPYELQAHLGAGGMGTVYRGVHRESGQAYAVKVVLPVLAENSAFVQRLEANLRVVAALHHPNIMRIVDVDRADGSPFIVMELTQGRTLADLVREGVRRRARLVAHGGVQSMIGTAHHLRSTGRG